MPRCTVLGNIKVIPGDAETKFHAMPVWLSLGIIRKRERIKLWLEHKINLLIY